MVLSGATALYIGNTSYSKAYVGDIQVWPVNTDYSKEYLTFEIISAGTIMFTTNNPATSISKEIQYKINNSSWETIDSVSNSGFTVSAGDLVRFKGTNARYCTLNKTSPRATFQNSTAVFNVYGNIMSLIYGDNFIGQTALDPGGYNFVGFFGSAKIVSAENLILPMETIPPLALINFMIESPTLTIGPKSIPATTIMQQGMQGAFARCSKLVKASEYSVTTLGNSGFSQTYTECRSLVQGPSILPIQNMGNCACYSMFNECNSLVNAPKLPCSAITQMGYYRMFRNCSSLMYIKCLAKDVSASRCTTEWVYGVNTTGGTFVQVEGVNWSVNYNGIPSGWVVIPIPAEYEYLDSLYGTTDSDNFFLFNQYTSSATTFELYGTVRHGTQYAEEIKMILGGYGSGTTCFHMGRQHHNTGDSVPWLPYKIGNTVVFGAPTNVAYPSPYSSTDPDYYKFGYSFLTLKWDNATTGGTMGTWPGTTPSTVPQLQVMLNIGRLSECKEYTVYNQLTSSVLLKCVPVKRIADGLLGLLDIITNTFYLPEHQSNLGYRQ